MAVTPIHLDQASPFIGEACALCKEEFRAGDEMVVCPEDAARHHKACWQANGNRCTAYGCTGRGEVVDVMTRPPRERRQTMRPGAPVTSANRRSKVRVMPATSFSWAQSCLILSIAVAIILCSVGCFGLWAIADYIATNILHWPYRGEPAGWLPLWQLAPLLSSAPYLLSLL